MSIHAWPSACVLLNELAYLLWAFIPDIIMSIHAWPSVCVLYNELA